MKLKSLKSKKRFLTSMANLTCQKSYAVPLTNMYAVPLMKSSLNPKNTQYAKIYLKIKYEIARESFTKCQESFSRCHKQLTSRLNWNQHFSMHKKYYVYRNTMQSEANY